tara:strand:+ start:1314 stop:1745 length:432 start_codon:yes stop_codon:yes gene_type:complete
VTKKLTTKEQLFVMEYLACNNGAEAARRAGYSEHTAKEIAHENLTKPHVQEALEAKRTEQLGDIESRTDWLVNRLTTEATDKKNGESTRVRALEVLGKVFGSYAPEKAEVTTYSGAFLADLDLNEQVTDELPVENWNESNDLH